MLLRMRFGFVDFGRTMKPSWISKDDLPGILLMTLCQSGHGRMRKELWITMTKGLICFDLHIILF